MNAAARLGAFAGAVLAVAGAAAAVGLAVGPLGDGDQADGHGHGDAHSGPVAHEGPPPGLAVTADGLTLQPAVRDTPPGDVDYAFRVVGDDGGVVRDFDVEHERRMHMIVVRRDLSGFRHLHPEMDADGTWRAPLRLAEPGAYRVFADFARAGRGTTLGVDLTVAGASAPVPLPPPADAVTAGAYRVSMDAAGDALTFRVAREGSPVTDIAPYLGARGHLVALREGDLAFLHVHPLDEATSGEDVRFRVEWPSAGRYRLFLQFLHRGEVVTAPFTVEVP